MSTVVETQPSPQGGKVVEVPMMPLPDLRTVDVPVGIPPSLASLAVLNEIRVRQHPQVTVGCARTNKYLLMNTSEELFMSATEESSGCLARIFCATSRRFIMNIVDNSGQPLIQLYRPVRCNSCLLGCACLQELVVTSPPGCVIAVVRQKLSCWTPMYEVVGGDQNTMLLYTIQGQYGQWNCCVDKVFQIKDSSGHDVGRISNMYGGCGDLCCGSPTGYKIEFTGDLNCLQKTILVGASFLMDYVNLEMCN